MSFAVRLVSIAFAFVVVGFALAAPAQADDAMPLHRAVAEGAVSVRVHGLGASSGDALEVSLRRLVPRSLRVSIAPGTIFRSKNPAAQDMAGARFRGVRAGATSYTPSSEALLDDDAERVMIVEAYCMNFHRANPTRADEFTVAAPGPGLAVLLEEAIRDRRDSRVTQAALWIARDGVSDAELARRFPVGPTDLVEARRWLAAANARPPKPASDPVPAAPAGPGGADSGPPEAYRLGEHGGMTFPDGATFDIGPNMVLFAREEGVVGVDGRGRRWVSRRSRYDGVERVVFVLDGAPPPPPAGAGQKPPATPAPGGAPTPAQAPSAASIDARYRLSVSKAAGAGFFDVPGQPFAASAGLKVGRGPTADRAQIEFAGLTCRPSCDFEIHTDGTLLVSDEGVRATDASKKAWISRRVSLDGKSVVVFLPAP